MELLAKQPPSCLLGSRNKEHRIVTAQKLIPYSVPGQRLSSHLKDERCDNALRGQGNRTPQGALMGIEQLCYDAQKRKTEKNSKKKIYSSSISSLTYLT
jgi:hypothetical protein